MVDKMLWFLLILLAIALGMGAWWSLGHKPRQSYHYASAEFNRLTI